MSKLRFRAASRIETASRQCWPANGVTIETDKYRMLRARVFHGHSPARFTQFSLRLSTRTPAAGDLIDL